MRKKGNIIIIEGPQGSGKSTMTNFIRDNLPGSNLYRLSGIKDKTKTGYEKNKTMYLGLINYMEALEETELNLYSKPWNPCSISFSKSSHATSSAFSSESPKSRYF